MNENVMKVVVQGPRGPRLKVLDLEPGVVFKYNGLHYLKTNLVVLSHGKYNCLSCQNFHMGYINECMRVEIMQSVLSISPKEKRRDR